jgi:hypothetical protein
MDHIDLRNYTPVYFKVEEFLPPEIYNDYGSHGIELFMDTRILWTMDSLRLFYHAPITINDYCRGGKFTQRGFRTNVKGSSATSQHCFGRACDFDIKGVSAEAFRGDARSGKLNGPLQHITRIEEGVNWCHIDCAGLDILDTGIYFFNA